MAKLGELLWEPDESYIEHAQITGFMRAMAAKRGQAFANYHDLWRWSVSDLEGFWRAIWDYYAVPSPSPPDKVLEGNIMPGARWFPGTRVNFTRYLLGVGRSDDVAVWHFSEAREDGQLTWGELRERVSNVAAALRQAGVKPGDRVAAYLPNTPEAVVAMLATTGIGAVWSSCSPDFGVNSALDRFQQIEPKVLFVVDGYKYGGKPFDRRDAVAKMLKSLACVEQVVYLPHLFPDDHSRPPGAVLWSEVVAPRAGADGDSFESSLPFDHPLWVVYSSGTTGPPKGMVHGHGGILLEHLKMQNLHMDLSPTSCMFFYTTTGWIMFNLLVGALITGASIVLYDGNPAYPDFNTLWRIVERTGATNFGTSPTFVNILAQAGVCPRERFDLSGLRNVLCTGAPLTPESFDWIYANVKSNLWVSSISGGTDTACGFVAGVPILPVHSGEIQAPCLGVDVKAFDADGNSVVEDEGELVITQPMPSMPLYFWDDPGGRRYHGSYFDTYPGVWRHGDLLRETKRGSYVISGRSDSTLNLHGIRIGSSEIYRTVEALPEVKDSIVVHLDPPGQPGQVVLFIVLSSGVTLDTNLRTRITEVIRNERSPRHVPDRIIAVPQVPYTLTGKKMEVPVKRILLGAALEDVANTDAMANPAAIKFFAAGLEVLGSSEGAGVRPA